MLGASNHYKLPISYDYTTAGRLRDIIATISAHAARLNSRAHKLSYDWDLMTFNPDISTGHRRVVDAMIVDRTARRADVMIGSYAPGDADSTIGCHTSKTTPAAVVVINFLGPIGYIINNANLTFLLLFITSGVVMTFSERLHSTNMGFVSTRVRFRPSGVVKFASAMAGRRSPSVPCARSSTRTEPRSRCSRAART